jgi:hypothetical protein
MTGPSPWPVLITTDLDRTLIFSPRATAELGGALPADPVEVAGGQTAGELCRSARDSIAGLPAHARMCVATSRSVARLMRLTLPFPVPYAIAANGGVVLVDGVADPQWAARTGRLVSRAAPAAQVRAVLAGDWGGSGGAGSCGAAGGAAGPRWLRRMGDEDVMCCLAIVDPALLDAEQAADVAGRCRELGWEASLTGRKLYAFPAGFGKEHAAAFVAGKVARETGVWPRRLAAGDTEHDRVMLSDADVAWVPARSELARCANGEFAVTDHPGHAAAAQITREWLSVSTETSRQMPQTGLRDHGRYAGGGRCVSS